MQDKRTTLYVVVNPTTRAQAEELAYRHGYRNLTNVVAAAIRALYNQTVAAADREDDDETA